MKKIHIKKPDIKGAFHKLKNLKTEDVKAAWKAGRERRARIIEERRNSAFARKMKPVYAFMNRFSLVFHALLACIQTFGIRSLGLYDRDANGVFVQCFYDIHHIFHRLSVQAKGIRPHHYQRAVDGSGRGKRIYAYEAGYAF